MGNTAVGIYLNLGSGTDRLPRYVNVDIADIPEVDVVYDLDTAPWPWADGSVSCIRAYDIFEHVDKPVLFLQACRRVLHEDGVLDIRVSHWKHRNAYTDPTHRRFCTEETFDYWVPGNHLSARYGAAYGLGGKVKFAKDNYRLEGQEMNFGLRKLP